ncbi:MAG TPA: hypothetical protein VFS35_00805 [Terrimicrobiaceae bacterium]|nr:hypothetical protein [Terrimicrobiaceae bacterium]
MRRPLILLLVVAGLAAGLFLAGWAVNRRLTAFVESEAFRKELDKQTSKGLHFEGHYDTIRRTGLLTARTEGFTGRDGVKAIKAISTGEVDARFNPWGIFRRRWQLDYVRIPSGQAEIQIYEPKPETKPPKPWYAIFLPDRVYLQEVTCESADVTWQLRGRKAGFFQTRLLITPYGRDFEYRASGGTLKTGMLPELSLVQTHLVITRELLTLHQLELAPGPKSEGRIRVTGQAGMRDDKSVSAEMKFSGIPVDPWVPSAWASLFRGVAFGEVVWQGGDLTLESSSGRGNFRIEGGRVAGAPFLEDAAVVTGKKSIEEIKLSRFAFTFAWKYPQAQVSEIDIEADGVFRLQGAVEIDNRRLNGTLQLGATPEYLDWLPRAERVFARERDGYLWTTVRLTGTVDNPREDLSPRVAELLKKSPGAALGIFFRRIGEWFEGRAEQ